VLIYSELVVRGRAELPAFRFQAGPYPELLHLSECTFGVTRSGHRGITGEIVGKALVVTPVVEELVQVGGVGQQ